MAAYRLITYSSSSEFDEAPPEYLYYTYDGCKVRLRYEGENRIFISMKRDGVWYTLVDLSLRHIIMFRMEKKPSHRPRVDGKQMNCSSVIKMYVNQHQLTDSFPIGSREALASIILFRGNVLALYGPIGGSESFINALLNHQAIVKLILEVAVRRMKFNSHTVYPLKSGHSLFEPEVNRNAWIDDDDQPLLD